MAKEDMKKGGNQSMNAGGAGPSGSHQGHTVKTYLPNRPVKSKSGNKSQSTGK